MLVIRQHWSKIKSSTERGSSSRYATKLVLYCSDIICSTQLSALLFDYMTLMKINNSTFSLNTKKRFQVRHIQREGYNAGLNNILVHLCRAFISNVLLFTCFSTAHAFLRKLIKRRKPF